MESEYKRMERAIQFIEENAQAQPGLDEVADHVGLSSYHFQRLFKRWTGVSPKRYLQFLTVEKAKDFLQQNASVLETAFEVGLSGPGRLHELFVSVEAITPGQYKSRGTGLTLKYGFHQTPFGKACIAMAEKGITDLVFTDGENDDAVVDRLKEKWAASEFIKKSETSREMLDRIFGNGFVNGKDGKVKLLLGGTNFQIKVWQALLRIPVGSVVSYKDMAKYIGRPEAMRAVAGAIASNPVAWLIPCHRVLRTSGEIGGYRWGSSRKKMMLVKELAGE